MTDYTQQADTIRRTTIEAIVRRLREQGERDIFPDYHRIAKVIEQEFLKGGT